jgi:DNA-binding response OmpR family regulator
MNKILIVEDHADFRRLIRMTLEFEDFEVHEAPDAGQGWAMARALQPDLVVLDLMLPGPQNGLDLCRLLRADPLLCDVPVVVLSARGSSADREAAFQAGANLYLVKPFSPMQLLELLGTLVPAAT